MSQTFSLQLATDTLSMDAEQLGVNTEQLQHISIVVSATIRQYPKPHLQLTYQIQLTSTSLADQLNWPSWEQTQVNFTDYLWEQTCLECFIAGPVSSEPIHNDKLDTNNSIDMEASTGYIEVNVSPSGRYALYEFDDYRSPSTLPPQPLLKAGGSKRAYIDWTNNPSNPDYIQTLKLTPLCSTTLIHINLSTLTFIPCYRYQCSFSVPLDQLLISSTLFNSSVSTNDNIKLLHPCVILWFDAVALYFAPFHASPPDFHQRGYWTRFNP